MDSNDQSDPVVESVSTSEAPKQAVESSSAEECDSLLPSAPLLSAKPATSGNEQTDLKNESLLVLEAQKEDLETSSLVESSSLVIELPALESVLGPLHQDEETLEGSVDEQPCCLVVNSPVGSEGILVDGCALTNQDAVAAMSGRAEIEIKAPAIDGPGCLESDPEFDRLAEFEYGANEICLNEITLKNEEIVSDLKSAASSVKDMQFSSGESQMASQEQSFSSAAMGLQEGGLYFTHNNTDLCVEGNIKSVMDPNDVVEGLHVDPNTLTSNLPNISADWCNLANDAVEGLHVDPHTSTSNLPNIDASLLGISAENSEKAHGGLGDQCFPAQDKVLTVGYAYAFERSTLLPVHEVEENSAKQEDSLQCCDPGMVLGSDSPRELTRQKTLKLNGILEGNNSVAIADISCITYERRGNAEVGQSSEDLSSLRRSSREKKYFKKTPNMQYSRKGSKKESMDFLSAAVRSKRSFVNRSARVSKWGLLESLSNYIKFNNRVLDQGTGIVSSAGRNRKKEKLHVGASSHGSNSKVMNRAPSGQFNLKLKLVRKDKHVIEPSPLKGTDSHVNPSIGSGVNQLELTNCVKDVTQESSIRDVENAFDIGLAKLDMVPENSGVAVHSVDKDLDATLMSVNCSNIGGSNLSDKELQKSGGSTDDTHLNSGTSPDSEVIHVPNSQLEVHHNVGMDSVKATHSPAENGTPAMAKTRKKKGKKEQMCQPGDSGVQNGHLSLSVINKTGTRENYSVSGTKQDMATRLDVDHDSVDSWNSTKLLTSAEAKGDRKPKGLKMKEKTKVKSKPASASRLKMDNSRKGKGDKWKLIGKGSISENGTLNLPHRKEDDPEAAGKHGMDVTSNKTNITSSGVASEDVTSLPVVPGVAGKQKTQPRTAWVCCDDCLKWRCIPAQLADIIEETNCKWTCKDNQDKAFADCSVQQEKSNAEINVELNLSEDEEGSDVHFSGKYYSLKHSTVPQQSSWMLIKSNIFLHRSRQTQTLDEIMVCHCTSSRDGKLGCRDDCLNRMLNIECVQGSCPCMDLCSNQQFQRQSYAKLKMFRSGKKGYGLQVLENISEGRFLIEYVGEVLDLPAYEARQRDYASKGHKHFYFMTLNGNEVIDACAKGNLGRFINHSCDPNCRTEKWMINGEICIGLFAVRDIKKGEELTFDYNYVRVFGAAAKKCYCGSPQCRGYIGGDRLDNEVVVQSDSDEEFPEPVALYENGEIADDINVMSESNSLDAMEEKTEDASLQNDAEILFGGKAMTDLWEECLASVGGQLHSISEKDIAHSSVLESEIVDKSILDAQKESPINRISKSITSSTKRTDNLSLNKWHPKSSLDSVDVRFDKSATETTGGKAVQSESRPRMKISRPSKSGKSKESNDGLNGGTIDKAMLTYSKSQTTPTKLKKLVESSVKHHFEIVEEKLNELLDDAGGICKRKDAFKGYLKLLVLTAASGDCNHHEAIQSNKDLSMILDAILKTKSRTVLTDILNKNGLQMLHSMMKKCRGNYNMIPILRKLLKVFEFLAERKILTLEHINGDPPRPGVESFRDSMLNLTEHEDWKVHQIARSFRDRWIPRTVKKLNCMEKGDGSTEFKRAPNGSRSVGSHHHLSDRVERPLESNYGIKQSLPPDHLIDSNKGSHIGEGLASTGGSVRKRKSRWDQLSVTVSPHEIKEQKIEPLQPRRREETIHDLHTSSDEIHHFKEDGEMQENEDAPPGFSCPSFGGGRPSKGSSSPVVPITQQYPGPLKCPSQVPLGYAQERYNSGSPVAYGIPFNSVQKFGTPQASTADSWVIAPGMPFRPFPPLPLCPREGQKREAPSASREGYSAALNHTNQGCPPSSSARLPNMIPTVKTHLQHDRGPYSVKRRSFKQRRNDFRKPPWGFDRGGHGSGRNLPRRPPDAVNAHPEYVNNGVEFGGNSC